MSHPFSCYRWLGTALFAAGMVVTGAAFAASVAVVEPFASTDIGVTATTSDTPTFGWTSSGAISRFELQLSDRADFNTYWSRSVPGTSRGFTYISTGWTPVNTSVNAPTKLSSGAAYSVRIKAFNASDVLIAQSAPVPFVARSLVSGLYCNPNTDNVSATNVNEERTRGVHVISNEQINPSIHFHVEKDPSVDNI